jgi:hypothetical protein
LTTVAVEEAQVVTYYSLLFLERLLHVSAPEDVLSALRPDGFRRWWHERLMPEERVVSLEPMTPIVFSFYFRPFLLRLVPDLLVMGRRGDKVRYLLRFLVPPRAWLIEHYGLRRPGGVWIHYLLHPLKFLYHICRDVVLAVLDVVARPFFRDGRTPWQRMRYAEVEGVR